MSLLCSGQIMLLMLQIHVLLFKILSLYATDMSNKFSLAPITLILHGVISPILSSTGIFNSEKCHLKITYAILYGLEATHIFAVQQ